jgi:hypothetical protein
MVIINDLKRSSKRLVIWFACFTILVFSSYNSLFKMRRDAEALFVEMQNAISEVCVFYIFGDFWYVRSLTWTCYIRGCVCTAIHLYAERKITWSNFEARGTTRFYAPILHKRNNFFLINYLVAVQERLLHATLEVNKLREERRKLMDINNELRAAGFQKVIF